MKTLTDARPIVGVTPVRGARVLVLLAALAMMLSSCSSSRDDRPSHSATSRELPEAIRDPVAPGECRLIGTVLSIRPPDAGLGAGDPCSRFPCAATVRLDSILSYGSAFPGALGIGQQIQIHFVYTLAPSKDAVPQESFSLPGLVVGDRFQADVSAAEELVGPGTEAGAARYRVTLYRAID